jgi:hypothetical protein
VCADPETETLVDATRRYRELIDLVENQFVCSLEPLPVMVYVTYTYGAFNAESACTMMRDTLLGLPGTHLYWRLPERIQLARVPGGWRIRTRVHVCTPGM